MSRYFDILFSLIGLIVLMPLFILLIVIGYFDTGSPLFIQQRIGLNQKTFHLMKFRSMKTKTASIATHLIDSNSVTNWGRILRSTKLDELPQLINVLIGDMSFVGPRPNLPNQLELIRERALRNVYKVRPGITGLSQIYKIDMSTPYLLAETDQEMISNLNLSTYFKLIFLTLFGSGFGDRIKYDK